MKKNAPRKALEMYRAFHQFDARKVGTFRRGFKIPDRAVYVGTAVHVLYRSDKTDPETGLLPKKPVDYIHEHDKGVKVYRCDMRGGVLTDVPAWITEVDALVKLGDSLGYAYDDGDPEGEIHGEARPPYPELYCTPNGKALLIIQDKAKVLALIWGGRLGVEPRGIVH